ncbi:hypothetical protein ABH935_003561 [Catenulispora sp. GAS73]|uniref:DUF742 domain-containing protein n=1 Tax=Catenulispora sp. GAS73 TaxID=3156269 RepID=UPI0035181BCD
MSTGSTPPRTSWPQSGPFRPPPRPALPRHAASDAAQADAAESPAPGPEPSAATPHRRARLERVYVITNGRSAPGSDLDLVTLIVATDAAPPGLPPEQATIMRLCRRPLSVAELSAHLRLPFSATAVLVGDLLAAGLAVQRRPVRPAAIDHELLEQVINGLRRL